jgi:hypothetical protein
MACRLAPLAGEHELGFGEQTRREPRPPLKCTCQAVDLKEVKANAGHGRGRLSDTNCPSWADGVPEGDDHRPFVHRGLTG